MSRYRDLFLLFCAAFLLFKTVYFRSSATTTTLYQDSPQQSAKDAPRLRSLVSIDNSSSDIDSANTPDLRPIQLKMIKALNSANASAVIHPVRSIRHTRSRLIQSKVSEAQMSESHKVVDDYHSDQTGVHITDHIEHKTDDLKVISFVDPRSAAMDIAATAITPSPPRLITAATISRTNLSIVSDPNPTTTSKQTTTSKPDNAPNDEWYSFLTNTTYKSRKEYFQAVKLEKIRRNTIHSKLKNITTVDGQTTGWAGYRLGDMFAKHWLRWAGNGMHHHQFNYPGSIAVEYMERLDDPLHSGDSDWNLMWDIVRERCRNESILKLLPDDHTLVIHLRTGDVIDKDDRPVSDFLMYNDVTAHLRRGRNYTRGLPFYWDIWKQVQSEGIKIDRILLLTGWHYRQNHWRSIEYIDAVIRFMETLVDTVDIRAIEIPDEDFLIMVNSKYFVKSGGGFSQMIGGMVERNGGRVFGFS